MDFKVEKFDRKFLDITDNSVIFKADSPTDCARGAFLADWTAPFPALLQRRLWFSMAALFFPKYNLSI